MAELRSGLGEAARDPEQAGRFLAAERAVDTRLRATIEAEGYEPTTVEITGLIDGALLDVRLQAK